MTAEHHESPGHRFRELPPVPYWAGTIVVAKESTDALKQALTQSARECNFTYSGFSTENPDNRLSYTFTRYPRHKFGIATDEQCFTALSTVTKHLRVEHLMHQARADFGPLPDAEADFRVVLGLHEGYGENSMEHTAAEVQAMLGRNLHVDTGSIFAVGTWGQYEEPAAIISGKKTSVQLVYRLAEAFKQSRFTIEDLKYGESSIVETSFCQDPDPYPSIRA